MEFNKAILDCMQQLRRRLREEQQLDIKLSQPDAIQAMLIACLCSGDETTQDLGKQLATYSDMPIQAVTPDAAPSATSVRIYRGQRVLS